MSCNSGTLAIYTPTAAMPWNKKRVQHFYRRLGFGAKQAEITQALTQTPANFVESIINNAIALGTLAPPTWENMVYSDYADPENEIPIQQQELFLSWENDMLSDSLRGRFTLFWSNHFVTRLEDYWCPSWMFNYYQTIQQFAFGNFKEFVRAIGITPAMIIFLNSYENTATEPNENYARELYELFTLGVNNNYTQTDIVETAKALTGYTGYTEFCAPITFNSSDFDSGTKTIFGQTGNWEYNDVIDILFQERATEIANYICTKLYKYFVSPEIDTTIISQLANTFINNNFELTPVYKQLFKSEHFFDDTAIGNIIKSPYDSFMCYINETEFPISDDFLLNIVWYNSQIGQELFGPLDVAGWQGNHDWINSSTLIGRWQLFSWYLWDLGEDTPEELRTFAINLCGSTETDPAIVTQKIVDHLLPNGLQTPADYTIATDVFKDEVPQNYYDDNLWNLQWDSIPYQVLMLLLYISKQPEFQLK